ncbi:MAG: uroporphyrinogen decarboxylase [Alphaproteobacteria bacterium]|nr:uroporphyrinogen decarboxylase [Alphaproteobacteria bacterium]
MLLIDVLQCKKSASVPFWFMRQAGRYLPEYKAVRKNFPDFLSFCYTPEAACEVTLQPISRFDMSAAIIFSDILVIPDALGVDVTFVENIGPVLTSIANKAAIERIGMGQHFSEKLSPVYKAISLTRSALAKDKALIGFCGSGWTLACYMLQGKSSRDFSEARVFALKEPELFKKLMALLENAITDHACAQIEAGANAIQLFDSWSGVLSEVEFEHYVVQPTKRIVAGIKNKHSSIPVIGFPRMCGAKLEYYAKETGVDAVSFDGSVSLAYAKKEVQPHVLLQGNLDSQILAEDKELALAQTGKILDRFAGTPFIFNLAHGILPHTPIANVQAVSDMIKNHA